MASVGAMQAPGGRSLWALAELRRFFAHPEKQKLRWWFEVGHQALRLHPEPPPGEKRPYGTRAVGRLAQQLSPEEPSNMTNTLWQARKLALRFSKWDELEKFQGDLSIWHVMSLLAVDETKGSKSSMQVLHARCVAEGWSVERLKREIQNDKGGKMASGRQPKPLRAATPAIAVKDLYFAARRWVAYHDQCLAGRRPLLKHARRSDYSGSLLRDAEETIQQLEQVQEAIEEERKELRQLAKNIRLTLKIKG
jgi:hypothetical protein